MQFWMDTIKQWERKSGKEIKIGLAATKDVMDAILGDPLTACARSRLSPT